MRDSVFLDTNVVLDLLGERKEFYDNAARIVSLADQGQIKLAVSSLTYATTFYLLSRFENTETVKTKIRKFKVLASTCDLTDAVVDKALNSTFNDFEDALQYYCALNNHCNRIVTRNEKEFKTSAIIVMSPHEYLKSLSSTSL